MTPLAAPVSLIGRLSHSPRGGPTDLETSIFPARRGGIYSTHGTNGTAITYSRAVRRASRVATARKRRTATAAGNQRTTRTYTELARARASLCEWRNEATKRPRNPTHARSLARSFLAPRSASRKIPERAPTLRNALYATGMAVHWTAPMVLPEYI